MLANVVDVFIIAESNISAGGEPKPLNFFEAFRSGFLAEFQHKILYVYRDHFPPGYVIDGWKADRYLIQKIYVMMYSESSHTDTFAPTCPRMECHALLAFHQMIFFSCTMQMRYQRKRQYFFSKCSKVTLSQSGMKYSNFVQYSA